MNKDISNIYGAIFQNAFKKLKAATVLYSNELYDTSYFLSVIAEEEVSKIIIVNIAKETGKLSELEIRSSAYYNHNVKQKIALSYNTLEKPERILEQIKQSSLYVGIGKGTEPIIPNIPQEKCYAELQNAIDTVIDFAFTKVDTNSLDEKTKNTIEDFKKFIDKHCPELRKQIKERHEKDSADNFKNRILKMVYSKTNFLILFLKYKYGEDNYKPHLDKVKRMGLDEMLKYLDLKK